MSRARPAWFSYVGFPLFIVLVFALLYIFRQELYGIFQNREAVRSWIEGRGVWGALAFVLLQVIQVVIFVIPGEIVQVAGGYVFGFWQGTVLSVVGITVGSVVNLYAGRILGRPFVEALFPKEKIEAVERISGSGKAAAGFFLLFVIPGIPKDVLCYVAGISRLSLLSFLAVSTLGRLPGIVGSSFMGSAAFARDYRSALVVLIAASVLFFAGLVFKERIEAFVARILHRGDRGP